ncbi:MAG: hypothetical protein IB618_03140 [Candidatus Pacearchaeota archaeon]|nr:MAG: hypothetical protein IB618_03140 [Candidatus Pacearchaeota archaeon]
MGGHEEALRTLSSLVSGICVKCKKQINKKIIELRILDCTHKLCGDGVGTSETKNYAVQGICPTCGWRTHNCYSKFVGLDLSLYGKEGHYYNPKLYYYLSYNNSNDFDIVVTNEFWKILSEGAKSRKE